jgi:outer membrane protein TolC
MYKQALWLNAALALFVLIQPVLAHETTQPGAGDAPEIIELPRDNTLTLAAVVDQALQRNPDRQTLQARLAELAAQRQVGGAWLSGAPAVGLRHQNDSIGSSDGLREWELSLDLPLWWPGQSQAMSEVGDRLAASVETWQAALHLTVAGKARELAWETALQENLVTLAEEEWDTALALEKDVRRRVEVGELARTDLLLAQDETLRKQAEYLDAEQRLRRAVDNYRLFTGLDKLPLHFEETPLANPPTNDDALNARLAEHPLLREAQSAIDRAEAEVRLAKQEGGDNPQLSLNARRERADRNTEDVDSVGISLRLPLGTSFYHSPRIAAARRALADAYSARDRLLRELQLAAHETKQAWQTAGSTLQLAQQQQILADESLRLARIAFKAGETDFIHLQRVQTLAFAANRAVLSRSLQAKSALARYHQALGILP